MASLTFIGHSTVRLDLGGLRILTDPLLRERLAFLRRVTAPASPAAYAGIGVVIVSHLHHDHCDLQSLGMLGAGTEPEIIVPAGAEDFLRRRGVRRVTALPPGGSLSIGPVRLTATPAAHDGGRTPWGPRAAAVGYLIETAETTVYFAGDTDLFTGMDGLCPGLDLALLPVWGWGPTLGKGHLDPGRAAEAVARLRPRHAVPVHWATFFPYGLAPLFGARLRRPGPAFERAVRARGLPTQVHVVEPGGELTWPT